MTYPYGVQIGVVRIDPETGEASVERYLIAYDIGRSINPMLVEGQLVGGVVQGLGGALSTGVGATSLLASRTCVDARLGLTVSVFIIAGVSTALGVAASLPLGLVLPRHILLPSEIREALLNLIFNAVDSMADGGKLLLRTKVKPVGSNMPSQVQVEVVDTGAGMDEATRRRCLEDRHADRHKHHSDA